MKKYSILGLSLLAVSAITAAFVPSKGANSTSKPPLFNGHLTISTGQPANSPDVTCREALAGDALGCSFTNTGIALNLSSTSGVGDVDSATFDNAQFTGTVTTAPANEDDQI